MGRLTNDMRFQLLHPEFQHDSHTFNVPLVLSTQLVAESLFVPASPPSPPSLPPSLTLFTCPSSYTRGPPPPPMMLAAMRRCMWWRGKTDRNPAAACRVVGVLVTKAVALLARSSIKAQAAAK